MSQRKSPLLGVRKLKHVPEVGVDEFDERTYYSKHTRIIPKLAELPPTGGIPRFEPEQLAFLDSLAPEVRRRYLLLVTE